MKSRICCDYRTTILSNSFFHATTLLSIYHEKFFKEHRFGFEQKLSQINGLGLKIPRIGGFAYPYSPPRETLEPCDVEERLGHFNSIVPSLVSILTKQHGPPGGKYLL